MKLTKEFYVGSGLSVGGFVGLLSFFICMFLINFLPTTYSGRFVWCQVIMEIIYLVIFLLFWWKNIRHKFEFLWFTSLMTLAVNFIGVVTWIVEIPLSVNFTPVWLSVKVFLLVFSFVEHRQKKSELWSYSVQLSMFLLSSKQRIDDFLYRSKPSSLCL